MLTERTRNILYWVCKVGGVFVSCLIPILAILERFPIWTTSYGTERSVGIGAILIIVILAIIFRRAVFKFIEERLKLNHAPPLAVWLILIATSYILMFLGSFLRDLTTVLWMGLIGCAIGTVITYVGEHFFGKRVNE